MAAATAGYEWSRSSPLRQSPDTNSPMYPDRPIRPLPKRRLRARLSPEQSQSIVLPEAPSSSGPLFSFPYSQIEKSSSIGLARRHGDSDHHNCGCGHTHSHSELESEEEEDERVAALQSSPSYQQYSRSLMAKAAGGMPDHYPKPGSAASSADGYESFENTNNKKKRKIPNMGGANTHHTNLSAEMASMGISRDLVHDHGEGGVGHYYGSGASAMQNSPSGTGISGPGRGRYARSSSGRAFERRVLGTSTNSMNAAKINGKREFGGGGNVKGTSEQGGIISTAIANAQAEQFQVGNENVSLLQQQAAKSHPNKTQFTFTCGSDSANKMVWPGQQNGAYPSHVGDPGNSNRTYPSAPSTGPSPSQMHPNRHGQRPVATQGTQTSPHMNGSQAAAAKDQPPLKQGQPQQAQQPRKPRRKPSKLYAMAARQRRLQQEYTNFHHPPAREDIWICEFCEYESIFGSPPEALVRQYEIKDRKERKRLAEKRRLLEKARMKGRKGKKQNKKHNNTNNNQQSQNAPPPTRNDSRVDDAQWDGQEDEYYEDEFDDVPPQGHTHGAPKTCVHPGCNHPTINAKAAPGDPRVGCGRAPSNGA